jgi:site-specific DNA-methyltransferase (adenine-specific)
VTSRTVSTTACKWDTVIPFEPLWTHYKRVIKPNGAIVLTASQPFTSALVMSNPKWFRFSYSWDKRLSSFGDAKRQPLRAHEDICVFAFGSYTYNPQMTRRTEQELKSFAHGFIEGEPKSEHLPHFRHRAPNRYTSLFRYPSTVLRIGGVQNRSHEKLPHPTQKPVALFEYLIKTYTNEGETVLDNCSGSGTTAIACINTRRNYICMEKEPKYVTLSRERVRKHLEQPRLLEAAD